MRGDGGAGERRVTGVVLASGEVLLAEQVVVALGPWTAKVEEWLQVCRASTYSKVKWVKWVKWVK